MSNQKLGGVYLLYSRFPDGRFIYKVGMSENLKCRINSYPPNWFTIFCHPCKNPRDTESIFLKFLSDNKGILGISNCIKGKEYFESDTDRRESIVNRLCELDSKLKDNYIIENICETNICSPMKNTVIICKFSNQYTKEESLKLIEGWKPSKLLYGRLGNEHMILATKENSDDSQIFKTELNGVEISDGIDTDVDVFKTTVDYYIETTYNSSIFNYVKIEEEIYSNKICIEGNESSISKFVSSMRRNFLKVLKEKEGTVDGKYVWYGEFSENVLCSALYHDMTCFAVECCPNFDYINISTTTDDLAFKDKPFCVARAILIKRKSEFMLTLEDILTLSGEDILLILSY